MDSLVLDETAAVISVQPTRAWYGYWIRFKSVIRYLLASPRVRALLIILILSLIIGLTLFFARDQVITALEKLRLYTQQHHTQSVLLMMTLLVLVNVPPMVGYGTLLVVSGFLFGMWIGWFINIIGTVIGALLCFSLSRWCIAPYLLRKRNQSYLFQQHRTNSETNLTSQQPQQPQRLDMTSRLNHYLTRNPRKVWHILFLLRFATLPYNLISLTLGQVPAIPLGSFMAVSTLATLKTLMHAFIGSTVSDLRALFERPTQHWFEIMVAVLGWAVSVVAGYYIYRVLQRALSEVDPLEEVVDLDLDEDLNAV